MYPLTKLEKLFADKFGPSWFDYEEETLSLELGVVFGSLLLQKIRLLQVLHRDAKTFEEKLADHDTGGRGFEGVDGARIQEDPLFFIYASDIINNQIVEPGYFTMPSSLEVAYALSQLRQLPINFEVTPMVRFVIENVLKNDGFTEVRAPFDFLPKDIFYGRDEDLAEKQSTEDVDNKYKGVDQYVAEMNKIGAEVTE